MTIQKTLVLIKPDGIQRGLIGKIITRFEEIGLKIVSIKMVKVNEDLAKKHYPLNKKWAENVFKKTKTTYEKEGKKFNYSNPIEFGSLIQSWNMSFLQESPIIAMIIEGPHAIEIVRKIVGSTEPKQAPPGTIRGDFASLESYEIANTKSRVLRNLVHASDSKENAQKEISIWFNTSEIHNYSKEIDKYFN